MIAFQGSIEQFITMYCNYNQYKTLSKAHKQIVNNEVISILEEATGNCVEISENGNAKIVEGSAENVGYDLRIARQQMKKDISMVVADALEKAANRAKRGSLVDFKRAYLAKAGK